MASKLRRTAVLAAAALAALALLALALGAAFPQAWNSARSRLMGDEPAFDAAAARPRLAARFAAKGCPYPPERVTLVALKAEKRLEVWAPGADGRMRLAADYPVLAASGGAGPKLREGDRQVPEGLYRIALLNPQSAYHLSMKLDYPNEFDRAMARRDGRANPGGDIFIHGRDVSIGCLAMGDPAIEELFALVKEAGKDRVQVVVAPADFRALGPRVGPPPGAPAWTAGLYEKIRAELARYPKDAPAH